MATAVDRQLDDEIAPAETAAAAAGAPAVQRRRGWIKRMVYSRVAEKGTATDADADDGATARATKPRRGAWLRRLVPERALRRKLGGGGAASRLLPGGLPRWKRVSSVGGGWASALLDAAAFRVMYVVEAVVLGLALSCFFCCCGCQI